MGRRGPAVVPGHPEKSLLIEAVGYGNPDLQMPPKEQLTAAQVADLAAWIKDGGVDPRDGATAAVDEDRGGAAALAVHADGCACVPAVKDVAWVANDIDRFVLAKLEAKGVEARAVADKRTLIRRATYDLTGLPPTPAEVEAFLADDSPAAFAAVVDRLLGVAGVMASGGRDTGWTWCGTRIPFDARDGGAMDSGGVAVSGLCGQCVQ